MKLPLGLTRREHEVIQLVAMGERVSSIAKILYISPHTVCTHYQSLRAKLKARTLAHAVAIFYYELYGPKDIEVKDLFTLYPKHQGLVRSSD